MSWISPPPNRSLPEGIRAVGFRKWYERELLSGHAHLVLTLLATLGALACLEAIGQISAGERLLDAALFLLSAAIGLWALRRYVFLLAHAERVANQADCAQCGSYGRLEVVCADAHQGLTSVRCKRCFHGWTIHE